MPSTHLLQPPRDLTKRFAKSREIGVAQSLTLQCEISMSEDRARSRITLADKVYHQLAQRITTGEYPANQKLPAEMVLSAEFGVSRPVLRAALDRPREDGMIHSRQGAGSFVRIPMKGALGYGRIESLADIQRCYEFRMLLEIEAAQLAAERRNAAAMAEIEQALEMLRDVTSSQQFREDADFAFHLAIARATNNPYFETTLRALRDHVDVGMKLHGQSLVTDRARSLRAILAEHEAIAEAIFQGRAAEAGNLLRVHLEQARERLFGCGLIDLRMK